VFLSLEDETGISNVIIDPDVFEKYKETILGSAFLLIRGIMQNLDGVYSVKAHSAEALTLSAPGTGSHDFH
jgi:error-prone DNA polymerase